MKKNYLLLCFGLLGIGVHAQMNLNQAVAPPITENFSTTNNTGVSNFQLLPKSGGDIVWQNNFDVPAEWTINNSGQTAATYGWDIGPTESSWWASTVINSTSGGNFAELGNGNPQAGTQALNVTYTLTNATPIPITTEYMEMSFEQYGARFNDAQEMYISTNGTTWTKVGDNSDYPVLSVSGGSPYPNASLKTINLTSYIPSGSTQLWVRFSWTTAYPAQASNPNAWVTYGWFIDDILITELYQDDLKLDALEWGVDNGANQVLHYYKTPTQQRQEILFGGVVSNQGVLDKTDAVFKAEIVSESYTGESVSSTILSGQTDTLYTSVGFTPPITPGTYTASGFEVQTAVDEVTTNNFLSNSINFEITNSEYARDNGIQTGIYREPTQAAYKLCNGFTIYEDQNVLGISALIDQTTSLNSEITMQIYDFSLTLLETSPSHTITATNLNSFLRLDFDTPIMLTQNTAYIACVSTFGLNGTADLVVGTSGTSPVQTSFLNIGTDWYYTTSTPMVRMHLECETINTTNPQSICQGESYTIGTSTYTTAGTYTDVFQSIQGCDSIVTTELTVHPVTTTNNPQTICQGESYSIGGSNYTTAGTYTDVLQSINGCDSTVTTELTVVSNFSSTNNQTICDGSSYTIGTSTYTTAGTYTDVLQSIGGCDSTVTTILTTVTSFTSSQNQTICEGESIVVGTNTYTTAGTYTDVLQSIGGCDSTVTTVLTVNPTFAVNNPQTICIGESYTIGTNTYTTAGTYTNVFQTTNGCDSTVTTVLTVTDPDLDLTVSSAGITLTATETNATYQWVDCNNANAPIAGATAKTFVATANGSYAVKLTSTACPGVTETSACSTINQVGISELEKDLQLVIFPNPAQNLVKISILGSQLEGIQVTDLNGKILSESKEKGAEAELNTSNLSSGVYLLNIQTSAGSVVKRFTKN